jgi:hypothetical protein
MFPPSTPVMMPLVSISNVSSAMYSGSGEASGDEFEGECDFDEDEALPELPLREGLGRTTTSWGWLEDLIGMRVIVGPVGRERQVECFFLSLLELDGVLLRVEQSVCLLLPQLAHDGVLKCWSCSCDWLMRW